MYLVATIQFLRSYMRMLVIGFVLCSMLSTYRTIKHSVVIHYMAQVLPSFDAGMYRTEFQADVLIGISTSVTISAT